MRNIRLTIEYDGSRYHGWQRLGAGEDTSSTISGKLSEVIFRMTGQKSELFCASRTETGVHAYAQTVNFHTGCSLSAREIRHYLNRYLPSDIAVLEVEDMPERFHASLNAKKRTYIYRISTAECRMYSNGSMYIICLRNRILRRCVKHPDFWLDATIFSTSLPLKRKKAESRKSSPLTYTEAGMNWNSLLQPMTSFIIWHGSSSPHSWISDRECVRLTISDGSLTAKKPHLIRSIQRACSSRRQNIHNSTDKRPERTGHD